MAREVAHHEVEDLIDHVVRDIVDVGVFQDQLAVHDQGEDLTARKKKIDVFLLRVVWWRSEKHLLESRDLLAKDFEIGCVPTRVRDVVVVEANLSEPLRWALIEEEVIVNRLVLLRILEAMGIVKTQVVTGALESAGYREFRKEWAPGLCGDPSEGYAFLLRLVFEELSLDLPGLYGEVGLSSLIPVPPAALRQVVDALNDLTAIDEFKGA